MMRRSRALVQAWLVVDFFGDARRSGGATSTLTTTIFTQSFLALVFAALLYPDTPVVPFAAANLSLSSLLIATGLLGNQDGTNRRLADAVLLSVAPVGAVTVLLARAGHAAFYVCLVTIGMALPPAVLLGFLMQSWSAALAYVVLACVCSGLACGTLGVLLRGLVRTLGHSRAALVGGSLKAMLLGGGIVLFALGMQRLQGTASDLPIGRLGAELLPPYQAARVLANPAEEAVRLLWLLAAGALLLVLAVALGDREPSRRAQLGRHTPLRRLLRVLAPRGPRLGIADFVAVSMWRSSGFRTRVLPLLGLPAGMVILSLPGTEPRHGFVFTCLLLQLPAIYLPFLIAFLPRADQGGTSWLFDQAPDTSLGLVQDATWRALITHVLLPVHAVALVLLAVTRPDPDVVAASLFAFGVAVVASRFMVRVLPCVPFTREGDADVAADLGALFASALVLGGLGTVFGAALSTPTRWAAAAVVVAAAIWCLRRPFAGPVAVRPDAAGSDQGPPRSNPQPLSLASDGNERPVAAASLVRELRAIVVLYGAVCVLPVLIGSMFAN
jgi:hypothetical protein